MLHNNGLLVNSRFNKYSNKTPEKFGYMKDMCGSLIPRCVFSYISFTPNFYIKSLRYKDYIYVYSEIKEFETNGPWTTSLT